MPYLLASLSQSFFSFFVKNANPYTGNRMSVSMTAALIERIMFHP